MTGQRLTPGRLAEIESHVPDYRDWGADWSVVTLAADDVADLLDHIDALQAELDALEVRETVEYRVVDDETGESVYVGRTPTLAHCASSEHVERWVGRTRVGPTVWTREEAD